MKTLKTLHFIHSLSGGGAEKQLTLLCNGIEKSEYEVAVFCVNDFQQEKTDTRVKIIKSHHYGISLKYILEVFRTIKTYNPDIIQIWLPPSISIPALLCGGLLRKKIIFSYRSKMLFFRGLCYVEYFLTLFFADKIIANRPVIDSNSAYKWLYKIKQGAVIYNAVSVPTQYQRLHRPPQNSVRFVFVGRLYVIKNGTRLIQALSMLTTDTRWTLDIFGKGEQEEEMRTLIAVHGLADKIFMRGYCNNVYAEMANADALLFPSLFEGMPNVLVEAHCMGLPVIASDIQANRLVVGEADAVIWIDPLDTLDMSLKISEFLNGHHDTQALTDAGKKVASQYTLKKMVSGYEHSYKN